MNEKQTKDFLEFCWKVVDLFDQREKETRKQFEQEILKLKEDIKKMLSDTEKALIKAFDDETNRIADAIAALDKDDPEFNNLLQAQVDKLKGVGANGTAPTTGGV